MKLLKFLILTVTVTLTFSCSTEDNLDQQTKISNSSILKNGRSTFDDIVKLDDLKEQILVASALTPDEKRILWQDKIDNFINNNTLNQNQLDYLIDLKSKLNNKDIFTDNHPTRIDFISNESPILLSQAQTLFGTLEGKYLLTKVENINHRIDRVTNGGGSGTPSLEIKACDCEDSDECYRITGVSIWGIEWEYGTCDNTNCYVAEYFFGFIESDNDGECKY